MKFVSPILKHVIYPVLSVTGHLRPRPHPGQLSILTYHGLLPAGYVSPDSDLDGTLVTADAFRAQMRLLKKRYHVIHPENLLAGLRNQEEFPPLSVLITCDDGLQNTLTDMLPILLEEGLPCLFFVTGASASESRSTLWYDDLYRLFLSAPPGQFKISVPGISLEGNFGSRPQRRDLWWDTVKRLSAVAADQRESFIRALRTLFSQNGRRQFDDGDQASCRRFGLLTAPELKQLAASGMTIGAHTLHHPLLSEAPPELAYAEIYGSKITLESVLQRPVWAFAYPFGGPEITAPILKMPRWAGFEAAFLNFGSGMETNFPLYALPRVHISGAMNLAEFEAHVSGLHGRLQRRLRPKFQEPENGAAATEPMTALNAADAQPFEAPSDAKRSELTALR